MKPVGEERLRPQSLKCVAVAVAIDPAHLGIETLGEGVGDARIIEVVEDVFLPVDKRLDLNHWLNPEQLPKRD